MPVHLRRFCGTFWFLHNLEVFLGSVLGWISLAQFVQRLDLPCGRTRIFLRPILTLYPLNPIIRSAYYPPSLLRTETKGQNINWLSIAIPHPKVWLRLGTPNPPMIAIAEETLDLRRWWFSHHMRLLIPTFSLPNAPAHFTVYLHSGSKCSPTTLIKKLESTLSVVNLAPLHFRRILPHRRIGIE